MTSPMLGKFLKALIFTCGLTSCGESIKVPKIETIDDIKAAESTGVTAEVETESGDECTDENAGSMVYHPEWRAAFYCAGGEWSEVQTPRPIRVIGDGNTVIMGNDNTVGSPRSVTTQMVLKGAKPHSRTRWALGGWIDDEDPLCPHGWHSPSAREYRAAVIHGEVPDFGNQFWVVGLTVEDGDIFGAIVADAGGGFMEVALEVLGDDARAICARDYM